jgi:hypothetical protein
MKSLSFFLVVYAMCLCPVIYEVNSTRKLSDVYSLDMIMSENKMVEGFTPAGAAVLDPTEAGVILFSPFLLLLLDSLVYCWTA